MHQEELLDDDFELPDDVLLAIRTAIAQFPATISNTPPFALLTIVQVRGLTFRGLFDGALASGVVSKEDLTMRTRALRLFPKLATCRVCWLGSPAWTLTEGSRACSRPIKWS